MKQKRLNGVHSVPPPPPPPEQSTKNSGNNMTVNFPRKAAYGKIPSLFLAFLVSLFICACEFEFENPWMKDILQEKTIIFDTNGGSSVPSQRLYQGERAKRPSNPYKANSEFQDWYKDNTTFLEPYDFSFIPKKDMTLYAKWDNSDTETPTPPEPPSPNTPTFSSVNELGNWLSLKEDNNSSNPYTVKIDVTDIISSSGWLNDDIKKIIEQMGKFVSLELTGSTFSTIASSAFSDCLHLTGIIIPNSVTGIRLNAFYQCSALTNITIPASVVFIGESAFKQCPSLTSVKFEGKDTSFEDSETFPGDLQTKYLASDGGIGIYTRQSSSNTWTKKN